MVKPPGVVLIDREGPDTTGLGRYSQALGVHLDRAGVNARRGVPRRPLPRPVTALARRVGWDLDAFFRSYPLAGDWTDGEVYHATSETLASVFAFSRPVRSVVTVHAFFSYLLRRSPELSMYHHVFDRLFDRIAARGLRRAKAIIAVSHFVEEALIRELGIPGERIHVVYEAVDHDVFRPLPVPDDFRQRHGLPGDRRYLLYVGSEQPRKNFLILLRAFARVRTLVPDLVLLKVGDPEVAQEREKALALIEDLGIGDQVAFFGHVGSELPLFYNASDLFVFPSRYEGFGFPPLEAMACGVPVICSNATSLPEVARDGALYFTPQDEDQLVGRMVEALTRDELRAEYRERGLRNASDFTWADTARQTAAVYARVAAEGES